MTDRTGGPLARFVDRLTVVYDRRYPHPIERVWDAVSTASHLDAWLLPECRVERRLGGSCAFGWGGPATEPAEITVWEPPRAVQYTSGDGVSFMRFDLDALDGSTTALQLTLHFLPPAGASPMDAEIGGDRPGGPDTAWRPGFLAGFHEMVDRLEPYLRGEWTLADTRRKLERTVAAGFDEDDLVLQQRYRQHVIDTIPGGAS